MKKAELYIKRCFDLARFGKGKVSPNPMVGAVIVYKDRIIGEGFHKAYGQAHAEVNAIENVAQKDKKLLKNATIFISLEPCCFFGNTPPCTDLIIKHKIPKVVFSSLDKTPGVDGSSVAILRKAGCKVDFRVLNFEGEELVRFRSTYVSKYRPYIILKYAQSKDGFIGRKNESVWLTNSISKTLTHKWRSESDAILVGTNTALTDNPQLTNRLYFGNDPLRIFLDKKLRLSEKLNLYDDSEKTWVITENPPKTNVLKNTRFVQMEFHKYMITNLLRKLYKEKISSLIVEGGAQLLQSFIGQKLWDEARIFVADKYLKNGIKAPTLSHAPVAKHMIGTDELLIFRRFS